MSTLNLTVLGGSGFVGRHLVAALTAAGHRVRVPTRRRARHRDLLVLPLVTLTEGDVHDPGFLAGQVAGADAVINLVAILNEHGHRGRGFEKAHVELAGRVIDACRAGGVRRLLHMSALHADPHGPSHYLRTKGVAEDRVHAAAGLDVTSFRPSVIFGPGDGVLSRFASLIAFAPLVFPLACPTARFQPVYVGDVVNAIIASIGDRRTFGQGYDLCGPTVYTLAELVAYTARLCGSRTHVVGLPRWLSAVQAGMLEFFPGKPFSLDNFRSLAIDSVCEAGFPELFGIVPARLEDVAPGYIRAGREPLDALRQHAGR